MDTLTENPTIHNPNLFNGNRDFNHLIVDVIAAGRLHPSKELVVSEAANIEDLTKIVRYNDSDHVYFGSAWDTHKVNGPLLGEDLEVTYATRTGEKGEPISEVHASKFVDGEAKERIVFRSRGGKIFKSHLTIVDTGEEYGWGMSSAEEPMSDTEAEKWMQAFTRPYPIAPEIEEFLMPTSRVIESSGVVAERASAKSTQVIRELGGNALGHVVDDQTASAFHLRVNDLGYLPKPQRIRKKSTEYVVTGNRLVETASSE